MISADRLTARPDGGVGYHFRRLDASGRTSVTGGPTWRRSDPLPADRAIFQVAELPEIFVVRADLAAAFAVAGLTGFECVVPEACVMS